MKKLFSLVLTLAAYMLVSSTATAGEIIYYGDYAFTLDGGKATIVDSNYNRCAPTWEDVVYHEFIRLGTEDESALFPKSCDVNGVWRIIVPSTLNGYPVVAIGDGGLDTSMRGDVVLPEGLVSIGAGAFTMCINADAITIPESVTFIGEGAFDICPATLKVIEGSYAAQYAEENNIPYTYDMEYAVYQSGDWRYTLAGNMATIYDCDGYMYNQYGADATAGLELVIPDQLDGHPVVAIRRLSSPYDALYDSGRIPTPNSIVIPASVTAIDGNPFTAGTYNGISASKLAKITVSPDNPVFESIDGVLFNKQENKLVAFPGIRAGAYSIPEGVTAIGDRAFEFCGNLTNVTIPDSVTEIGSYAFYRCDALASLTIPDGAMSIGDFAFYGCKVLSDVSLPEGITRIGENLFYECALLSSVTIPEGVTYIGESAFGSCLNLRSITIPASVIEIVGNPFAGCRNLSKIDVSPDNLFYKSMDGVLFDKQRNMLIAFPGGLSGDYAIPEGVTDIGEYSFYRCELLTGVILPEGIVCIGEYAFRGCSNLKYVTIPEGLTSIGEQAFFMCTRLTSVSIPTSTESIGDWAFSWCESLKSATIAEGVKHIGRYAFSSCNGLTKMTIPGSVTDISDSAFSGCKELDSVIIQEGVTSIGNAVFDGCERLANVTIPESMMSIGDSVFAWCNRLTRITIPANVTSIGKDTFRRYDNKPVPLSVSKGSYAEKYAQENEISYIYTDITAGE